MQARLKLIAVVEKYNREDYITAHAAEPHYHI